MNDLYQLIGVQSTYMYIRNGEDSGIEKRYLLFKRYFQKSIKKDL